MRTVLVGFHGPLEIRGEAPESHFPPTWDYSRMVNNDSLGTGWISIYSNFSSTCASVRGGHSDGVIYNVFGAPLSFRQDFLYIPYVAR